MMSTDADAYAGADRLDVCSQLTVMVMPGFLVRHLF